MAIDARLALAGQGANIPAAVASGLANSNTLRTQGVRERLLNQQAQAGAMQNAQTQGAYMNQLATGLLNKPLDERAAIVAQQLPFLSQMGINPQDVIGANLSNEGLNRVIAQTNPFVNQGTSSPTSAMQNFDFFQGVVDDPNSSPEQVRAAKIELGTEANEGRSQVQPTGVPGVVQIFNPNDETLSNPMKAGADGKLVELTRQEMLETGLAERVQEVDAVGEAETQVLADREEELRAGKLTTAQALAEIELSKKRNEALTADQVNRLDSAIETGIGAVNALPDINRGLELLKTVKTGGLDAKAKQVTDFFGTTSGDVGELNNILAENVLQGLSAFTGAISDAEREFIEKMNTGLAQGRGFNIAQLNRMRNIYQREVDKGLQAAKIANDEFAVGIFEDAIKADPTGFAGDVAEKAQSNLDFVNGL